MDVGLIDLKMGPRNSCRDLSNDPNRHMGTRITATHGQSPDEEDGIIELVTIEGPTILPNRNEGDWPLLQASTKAVCS